MCHSRYLLYETKTRYFLVGSDAAETTCQLLKIDRTSPGLSVTNDDVTYTNSQFQEVLAMIADGNKRTGGLHNVGVFCGVIGFVAFLEGYYMILIKKVSSVAIIGGHFACHIDEVTMLPLHNNRQQSSADETRYLTIFQQTDLTKNFYFSYTYNICLSLQENLRPRRRASARDMFEWNAFLALDMPTTSRFRLHIMHGFVDQSRIMVFGQSIFVTLIGRRSRHFAGARFLKRGVNDEGYVANDVETEQIVHDISTTAFFAPNGSLKPTVTSYVQHRGSIPLYWGQEASGIVAKPNIEINLHDPFYSASARHFSNLFDRYGAPVLILNLIKAQEKAKREAVLLDPFAEAVAFLNQALPSDERIHYYAWDMASASKSADENVMDTLEDFAESFLQITGVFSTCTDSCDILAGAGGEVVVQRGVVRTNCIDCLDRTNAAQFVMGKNALAYQLFVLGIIETPYLPFDCAAVNLLNAMYHDHGDTLAQQYGGSHLVDTMETYRKISPWTSHSRDLIESIRRYYSNSFTDVEKQASMNLFLGKYRPVAAPIALDPHSPHSYAAAHLWDLPGDSHLHFAAPSNRPGTSSYAYWRRKAPSEFDGNGGSSSSSSIQSVEKALGLVAGQIDLFNSYYSSKSYTSFQDLFFFDMISTESSFAKGEVLRRSPFAVSEDAPVASKPFMIYSLDIGDVKRWLSLTVKNKKPTPKSCSGQKEKGGNAAAFLEDESHLTMGDASGTSVFLALQAADVDDLINSLLTPTRRHPNYAKYLQYLNEFNPDSMHVTTSDAIANFRLRKPEDYAIFEAFVANGTQVNMKVAEKDFELYVAHVNTGRDRRAEAAEATGLAKRRDEYAAWLDSTAF